MKNINEIVLTTLFQNFTFKQLETYFKAVHCR